MNSNMGSYRTKLFWYEKDGQYVLKEELAGGKMGNPFAYQLPSEPAFMEQQLQELQISHKRVEDKCVIYNPEVIEWTELTAPVAKFDGRVQYVKGELHTGKVPTQKMQEAASKYYWTKEEQIREIEYSKGREDFEKYFARESEDGICCWWEEDYDSLPANEMDKKYVLVHLTRPGRGFDGLVLLKSAASGKTTIILKVHEWDMGRVIGKGGKNVKKIAEVLGVKTVKVKSIEGKRNAM